MDRFTPIGRLFQKVGIQFCWIVFKLFILNILIHFIKRQSILKVLESASFFCIPFSPVNGSFWKHSFNSCVSSRSRFRLWKAISETTHSVVEQFLSCLLRISWFSFIKSRNILKVLESDSFFHILFFLRMAISGSTHSVVVRFCKFLFRISWFTYQMAKHCESVGKCCILPHPKFVYRWLFLKARIELLCDF